MNWKFWKNPMQEADHEIIMRLNVSFVGKDRINEICESRYQSKLLAFQSRCMLIKGHEGKHWQFGVEWD